MNCRSKIIPLAFYIILALALYIVFDIWRSSGPPTVPFDGIKQKQLLMNESNWCPNGDGSCFWIFSLYKFDAAKWIKAQRQTGNKWVRGPIQGTRYAKLLDEAASGSRMYAYAAAWAKSDSAYFYLEDFKQTGPGWIDVVGMWVLDARSYRLYYLYYGK